MQEQTQSNFQVIANLNLKTHSFEPGVQCWFQDFQTFYLSRVIFSMTPDDKPPGSLRAQKYFTLPSRCLRDVIIVSTGFGYGIPRKILNAMCIRWGIFVCDVIEVSEGCVRAVRGESELCWRFADASQTPCRRLADFRRTLIFILTRRSHGLMALSFSSA